MYRVKQIIRDPHSDMPLDDLVNQWLIEKHRVNLVDIKYQSNITAGYGSLNNTVATYESVLIIYKEGHND